MIILGLSGKARAGKSTLCQELCNAAEKLGWEVAVKPFAGPLKNHVSKEMGYSKEKYPEKYRENCQAIGAERRKEDPDYWVKLWYKDMVNDYESEMETADVPVLYLVDDVRYPNELTMLSSKKVKATLVFVKHKTREIEDPLGDWRNHESEKLANASEEMTSDDLKEKLHYDFVVHNDKSKEDLSTWATSFISYLSDTEPCLCEACTANFEMRSPDPDKIDQELKEFLDDVDLSEEGDNEST
tara:strand:- start:1525 stop:2250 length:726 start_codon:yes stop_codon:yes gene_type:complete